MNGITLLGAVFAELLVRPWSQTNEPLEARVARDFAGKEAEIVHYDVPPMSGVQRLPDVYPYDGFAGRSVGIVLAKEEFEPGSFLLWSERDFDAVQLSLSEFRNEKGDVLPPSALDLKVIKVWYQNRNAWYSYFGDTGFKLVPELLLNDESLIRVDTAKTANFARLTEQDGTMHEHWLNPPRQINTDFWNSHRRPSAFKPMAPNFCDADTLRPVSLRRHAFKQFFLTVHATKDTPAGLYQGEIALSAVPPSTSGLRPLATIPVVVRVLDFVLPKPATYFDEYEPFYVTFYDYTDFSCIMWENGGDLDLTRRQYLASVRNHAEHGHDITILQRSPSTVPGREALELNMKGGNRDDVVVSYGQWNRRGLDVVEEICGHRNVYIMNGDEPAEPWIVDQRDRVRQGHRDGFKYFLAGSDRIYRLAGYQYDWHNISCVPEDGDTAYLWQQFRAGRKLAWYSKQHVGVENPDFNRRQNGLCAYLAGFTALANYAHHFSSYNDDVSGYKPMVFTYGQGKGVIDTLQWEGFREGLDDIRYATLMVRLARRAVKSHDVDTRYLGAKALQLLASFKRDEDDLTACRYEMIRYIQRLQKAR